MMIFDPPLGSPEYREAIRRLISEAPTPPREDWPIDREELARHHDAQVTMCLEAAARHARIAMELRAADLEIS